jgi:hypothetical protein
MDKSRFLFTDRTSQCQRAPTQCAAVSPDEFRSEIVDSSVSSIARCSRNKLTRQVNPRDIHLSSTPLHPSTPPPLHPPLPTQIGRGGDSCDWPADNVDVRKIHACSRNNVPPPCPRAFARLSRRRGKSANNRRGYVIQAEPRLRRSRRSGTKTPDN